MQNIVLKLINFVIFFQHKSRIEAGDGSLDDLNFELNDDDQNHLTAEEMIQYLATLSQNGDIGSARGVKWGV